MATLEMSILNHTVKPNSDDVYPAPLDTLLTMTNAKDDIHSQMNFPTGSDIGLSGDFKIPQNYAGSPVMVVEGVLDGTPANTLAFGVQQIAVTDSETVDVAYEAEDTASNSTWTGYADKDFYRETIILTPASAYQVGDRIFWFFFRDDSADDTTFNFSLTDLLFQYSDT